MVKKRRPAGGGGEEPAAAPVAPAPQPDPPAPPAPAASNFRALLACHGAVEVDEAATHGPVDRHPDAPGRLESCVARLKEDKGLWRSLRKLPPRRAEDKELRLCHDEAHIIGLQKFADMAAADLKPHYLPVHGPLCLSGPCSNVREGEKGADTFVTRGSLEAARFAVGGMLQLVDAVLGPVEEGAPSHYRLRTGMALCRPPGHHASNNRAQGFCLLNNVAVAAAYARKRYPEVKRVLIFDWDVHHGQGTQAIFEDSPDVLVVSTHRHDGRFYPATGHATEVGFASGRGYTVNIPLPGGYGGAALWEACASVLVPAARQFKPQLIIVSAGFDAVANDPLGGCTVEAGVFGVLTTELLRLAAEVAEGRLLLALEGGYHLSALADCVESVVRALAPEEEEEEEEEPRRPAFADPPAWLKGDSCRAAIRRTCEAHKNLPLRLPVPTSKSERRRAQSRRPAQAVGEVKAADEEEASPVSAGVAAAAAPAVEDPPQPPPREAEEPGEAAEAAEVAADVEEAEEAPAAPAAVASTTGEAKKKARRRAKSSRRAQAPAAEPPSSAKPPASFTEVVPGELVFRIPLLSRPGDVLVSARELWLLPGAGATAEAQAAPRKWSIEGAEADVSGALRHAEFNAKKRELTLRLRLGPILGGVVRLTPIA